MIRENICWERKDRLVASDYFFFLFPFSYERVFLPHEKTRRGQRRLPGLALGRRKTRLLEIGTREQRQKGNAITSPALSALFANRAHVVSLSPSSNSGVVACNVKSISVCALHAIPLQ